MIKAVCVINWRIARTKHCKFSFKWGILIYAVLGGEVAVPCNSQSAQARLNSFLRLCACRVCLLHVALKVGSRAMGSHEPCQVRKEAALSGFTHVPWGSLTRAGDKSSTYVPQSRKGARHYWLKNRVPYRLFFIIIKKFFWNNCRNSN